MKKISLLIFLLLLLPALARAEGFLKVATAKLEEEVRAAHDLPEVLERLSQLRSYTAWPAELDPKLKLYVAIKWLEKRQSQEAYGVLKGIAEAEVDPDLYRFYLASALVDLGYAENVRELLTHFDEKMPEDPDYLFLKSSYLALEKLYAEAAQTLTLVIKKTKGNGKAYLQRGILHVYSLSHELAYKDFQKAVRLLPEEDRFYRQMAYLQMGLIEMKYFNNIKKAKKNFRTGVAIDPESTLVTELAQKVDLRGL